MNDSIMLAAVVYSSWTARIFSADGLESLLVIGMFAAAVVVPLLARRRPGGSPYFSGVFVLALCPFLFAAVVVGLRIHSLIEYEDNTPDYVVERLQSPLTLLVFGGGLSTFAVLSYSSIRAAVRRAERLQAVISQVSEEPARPGSVRPEA